MPRLTKQQILNSRPLPTEDVPVPEWAPAEFTPEEAAESFVTVRALNGRQRDAYEASNMSRDGGTYKPNWINTRARLVGLCMVDENGKRTHTDAEVASLGETSAAALDRVFDVCKRLAGLTPADVEEMEKNSEPAPNESSLSTSA